MKPINLLLAFVIVFFALTASAGAQSPREQFSTAVTTFLKSATEDNARKLAELYRQLDPAPAVPEESEFRALKGAAFVKQGRDSAAFLKAAAEFQAAITIAPWVGEYHYNVAVCEKSASRFPAALAALRFAQIFALDDKARRDCLILRAELEAAQEIAAAETAKSEAARKAADTPQAREAALLQKVEGARFVHHSNTAMGRTDEIFEIRNRTLILTYKIFSYNSPNLKYGKGPAPGEYPISKAQYRDGVFSLPFDGGFTQVYRIRPDGQALIAVEGFYNNNPSNRTYGEHSVEYARE